MENIDKRVIPPTALIPEGISNKKNIDMTHNNDFIILI